MNNIDFSNLSLNTVLTTYQNPQCKHYATELIFSYIEVATNEDLYELLKALNDINSHIQGFICEKIINNGCSTEMLVKLSEHTNWEVRMFVAQYENCPDNILYNLAQDFYANVRRCVAKNKNSSKQTLELLKNDNAKTVLKTLYNRNI